MGEIDRRIDELVESLTPTNKVFVDPKLAALRMECEDLHDRLGQLDEQ